jgi:hypothetical protein
MSRTALIIEGRRLPRLSFRDEILMMLEASELLKIVRKRKTPIARFKGIISLLNKQDLLIMSDDLRKYFTPETVSKLRNKNFGDAASLQLRSSFDEPIVFTDIPIRPFDLRFGLSVVGTTGPGLEKVWGRAAKVVAPSSSKRRWRLPRGTNQRSQPKPRGV